VPEVDHCPINSPPVRIEPDNRLVVLARTIQVGDSEAEAALSDGVIKWVRFGDTCLGQALYRHRSVFQNASDAPMWSHFELTYFREIVPANVILELVSPPLSKAVHLLRAEILLTTPSSFVLPRGWKGSADRPERTASLEYISVQPRHLCEYRNVMRNYCGPAAARLVQEKRFGTFRAMETAAVLFHAPELTIDWNQIHLCELDPSGFDSFGKEFAAALRVDLPNGADLPDAFAGLARIRTIPRWTFNDFVVESDIAIAREI